MAARFVADELDLDLTTLAAALLVIVIVIVRSRRALALDAAALVGGTAVANRLRLVELGGRILVVLVRDVGHCCGSVLTLFCRGNLLGLRFLPLRNRSTNAATNEPMLYGDWVQGVGWWRGERKEEERGREAQENKWRVR